MRWGGGEVSAESPTAFGWNACGDAGPPKGKGKGILECLKK